MHREVRGTQFQRALAILAFLAITWSVLIRDEVCFVQAGLRIHLRFGGQGILGSRDGKGRFQLPAIPQGRDLPFLEGKGVASARKNAAAGKICA